MEKERAMYKTNRHRMIVHSFTIGKPEQVHHFQIRLPRNAKQVVAIDYDLFVNAIGKREGVKADIVVAPKVETNTNGINETVVPREQNANGTIESDRTNHIKFILDSKSNPVAGRLKLQSLEKANIFYCEWLKALEWNIGINNNGIFPFNPFTLLNKVKPIQVEVPPQTTILNGFYEDTILKNVRENFGYKVKVFVWLEMKEDSKGVEFDFLKTK